MKCKKLNRSEVASERFVLVPRLAPRQKINNYPGHDGQENYACDDELCQVPHFELSACGVYAHGTAGFIPAHIEAQNLAQVAELEVVVAVDVIGA